MTTDFNAALDLIEKLDEWANKLAAPLLPPIENPAADRLEFRQHIPHTVMIGKCVRAVSGVHAALALADLGYVAECAAIMRMVSDFCTEIITISKSLDLDSEGELPDPVRDLVGQYFAPKPRTLDQYKKAKRPHYPSRKDLAKVETRWAEMVGIACSDDERRRELGNYLNSIFDAYVHGAYETTMELYDPGMGHFRMRGFRSQLKQQDHVKLVFAKLHGVVCALEHTAAVTAHEEVWKATGDARRALDGAGWSRLPSCDS